jgi:hypothetical protein
MGRCLLIGDLHRSMWLFCAVALKWLLPEREVSSTSSVLTNMYVNIEGLFIIVNSSCRN